MSSQDLIEGLKYAITKGATLDQAMMSFYNAGYAKEEIEEAARMMQAPATVFSGYQNTGISTSPQNSSMQVKTISSQPQVIQNVSNYGHKPNSSHKTVTIVLVSLLALLLGTLIMIFIFKDQLSNFLNGLLG